MKGKLKYGEMHQSCQSIITVKSSARQLLVNPSMRFKIISLLSLPHWGAAALPAEPWALLAPWIWIKTPHNSSSWGWSVWWKSTLTPFLQVQEEAWKAGEDTMILHSVLNSLAVTHSTNFHKFRVLWMYPDLFCAYVKWLGGLIREFGKKCFA